jgi:single-stranded-DNA-specific exonuclease
LNAVGRLGSPQESFDLLVSDDNDEINRIVKSIESTNKQRQQIQGDILEEAIAMVDESKMEHGIFLVNPNWNIGVVGVVASEIVKRFNKPTVVIGKEKSIWKGSGRSVKGISLIKILSLCSNMFDKYGGHDYAAGVTLNKDCVHSVVQEFNNACKKILDDENQNSNKVLFYDAVLKLSTINLDTYNNILCLYPYCETNNPEPIFRLSGVSTKAVKTIENDNWTLFIFSVEGITECEFKTFDSEFSNCLNYGNKVNLYFKFPQNFDDRWKMSLEVVGVEVLEI